MNKTLTQTIIEARKATQNAPLEEALVVTKVLPNVKKIMAIVEDFDAEEFENLMFNLAIYANKNAEELAGQDSRETRRMELVYKNLFAAATTWKKRSGN